MVFRKRIKELFINKNNFKIYSITKENYKKFKNKKCNIFIKLPMVIQVVI